MILLAIPLFLFQTVFAQNTDDYRELTRKVRNSGNFVVPWPGNSNAYFHYQMQVDSPLLPHFKDPMVDELPTDPENLGEVSRAFWDKMLTKKGSVFITGEDVLPLTCVVISGQDNRYLKARDPSVPEILLRVWLVVGDETCTGPINPEWPSRSSRRENWDTYLYFEIKNLETMAPTDVRLKYRRTEYYAFPTQ